MYVWQKCISNICKDFSFNAEKSNYEGSKSSIKIIQKNLQLKCIRCNDDRQFLIERNYIITARIKFLRKMN